MDVEADRSLGGCWLAPVTSKGKKSNSPASQWRLSIGFVPLIDAAPLIAAQELGYFADEDIRAELSRQIGWGNVRDKLTFGRLDAAHALVGMPLFSQLSRDWFAEPLVSVMNLGSGGSAITLSRRLIDAGVHSCNLLADYLKADRRKEALVLAHVFSCSMHHFLLREWLASAGIDPNTDVRLRVFPPSQMPENMAKGHLDGFCAGEPWNSLAERIGAGRIVAMTTDIVPNHPEKTLVVSRRWAKQNASQLPRLIRPLLLACSYCDEERNIPTLAEMLSRPHYFDTPAETIEASLRLEKTFLARTPTRSIRPNDWRLRSFAAQTTFPGATQSLWMLRQMVRWHQLSKTVDEKSIAGKCVDTAAYREAAASLGITCPETDWPPMPLRNGLFDPAKEFALAAEGVRDVTIA